MPRNVVEVDPQKFPWLDLNRYTFCLGAESGGILYLAGQTASEYDPSVGAVVCKGDLLAQTRVIYEKLGVVLEAAGMSFDNVVQTVDYIDPAALPQYRETGAIRREFLGGTPVGSTGICVERLLRPDALLEVSAVAVRDEKRAVNPGYDRYGALTYVPGVVAGDTLWTSGFVGNDEVDGQASFPQDTGVQMGLTYEIVGSVLAAAGAAPSDVVKTLEYVSPQAWLQYDGGAAESRSAFFKGDYPANTGITVNRLLRPEGHVEVEAVAVLDRPSTSSVREEIQVPGWEASYSGATYVPGVKKGRMLQLSAQSGVDHATASVVAPFDIVAQAEQAYGNLARVLAEGGYSMDDVVNTIEWVPPNGLSTYRRVGEVRRKFFGEPVSRYGAGGFPSATGVSMHRIRRPGPLDRMIPELLFEVTAVAIV